MSKKVEERWVYANYEFPDGGGLSYSSLNETIKKLQEAKVAEDRGEWKELHIDIEERYESHYIILSGQRLETDKEKAAREQQDKQTEEWQRKQYEQLKAKFEGSK